MSRIDPAKVVKFTNARQFAAMGAELCELVLDLQNSRKVYATFLKDAGEKMLLLQETVTKLYEVCEAQEARLEALEKERLL